MYVSQSGLPPSTAEYQFLMESQLSLQRSSLCLESKHLSFSHNKYGAWEHCAARCLQKVEAKTSFSFGIFRKSGTRNNLFSKNILEFFSNQKLLHKCQPWEVLIWFWMHIIVPYWHILCKSENCCYCSNGWLVNPATVDFHYPVLFFFDSLWLPKALQKGFGKGSGRLE